MSEFYAPNTKVIVIDWISTGNVIGTVVGYNVSNISKKEGYYAIRCGLPRLTFPFPYAVIKYTEIGKLLYV